jgi:N-acetylmuramoyl-L-alanine amidase
VFSRVQVCALLLLITAGCSTAPTEPPNEETVIIPSSDITAEPAAKPPATPSTNHVVAVVSAPKPTPKPAPVQVAHLTVPPALTITNHTESRDGWMSLERWSEVNGLGTLHRTATDEFPTYSFASSNGTMFVKIGSQLAYWNGLEYRLGFAPQLIDGQPYIHAIDAQKNFVPLMAEPIRLRAGSVIVIDPGHGGTDVGASSVYDGHYEKEYTLDCARRLQAVLAGRGWAALLTRTNDVNVPLSSRVAFAEEHKADFFLSLHFNSAYPDRTQAGLETYCLTPAGMPSSLTRGYKDDASLVYPNNSFDRENLQYAVGLHRAVLKINGDEDRGVRHARFLGVLQGQNRPAILVEGGYLSNPLEARQIADPAYRQRYAEALAGALLGDTLAARTNLITQSLTVRPSTNLDGKIN